MSLAIWFPLGPCPIHSQKLCHKGSMGCGFYFREQFIKFDQVVVGYSHNFCATSAGMYHPGKTLSYINRFLARLVFTFLFWEQAEYLPMPWTLESSCEVRQHQYLSMFNEIWRRCLQQQSLTISLWGSINNIGNHLSCLGISMGLL